MDSRLAYVIDSSSLFYELDNDEILILNTNYKYRIVHKDVFTDLYYVVDHNMASLKEDCIEYCLYSRFRPLHTYPLWYLQTIEKGLIYKKSNSYIWSDISGDITMSEGSYILRNFKGDLKYMESDSFEKYYNT